MDFRRMILGALVVLALTARLPAAEQALPPFRELYELLRTNLAGVKETDLERAAAQGLLKEFYPQVSLAGAGASPEGATNSLPAVGTATFDGAYGYVRISRLNQETAQLFKQAYQGLSTSNRLKGLVLDLRFGQGAHYSAAAAIADEFFPADQPLVDWGEGMQRSTDKPKPIQLPLAILVNSRTSGAGEALAAVLRKSNTGLVLGSRTAGRASIAREFPLSNGQQLRIATAPIKLGSGNPVPLTGLTPDIQVAASPEDEQLWLADAYKVLAIPEQAIGGASTNETQAAATNRTSRRRINEAELVRMQRDGFDLDIETNATGREAIPGRPTVQDPALARALDLLKGLAVVRQFRGP